MNKGTHNIKNNFEPKIVYKYMHKKPIQNQFNYSQISNDLLLSTSSSCIKCPLYFVE